MVEDEHLLDQAIDLYLTGLKGLGSFVSEPSAAFFLSFEQYLILHNIVHHPGVKLMDIAKDRAVTRSAVSRQLKVLLTNHYVIQKKDPVDRRRQSLVATSEGIRVEKQITQRIKKRFSNWLTIFGMKRGGQLLDLLSEFNQQIVQANTERDESK